MNLRTSGNVSTAGRRVRGGRHHHCERARAEREARCRAAWRGELHGYAVWGHAVQRAGPRAIPDSARRHQRQPRRVFSVRWRPATLTLSTMHGSPRAVFARRCVRLHRAAADRRRIAAHRPRAWTCARARCHQRAVNQARITRSRGISRNRHRAA